MAEPKSAGDNTVKTARGSAGKKASGTKAGAGAKSGVKSAAAKSKNSGKAQAKPARAASKPAKAASPAPAPEQIGLSEAGMGEQQAAQAASPIAAKQVAAPVEGEGQAFTPPSFAQSAGMADGTPGAGENRQTTFSRQDILKAWWQAARPPFYIVTIIPLILGFLAAAADSGTYHWLVFLGALLVCFALHLAANLGNDLFDHFQGTDTEESIGGSRVLQQGKITVAQLTRATVACYVAAFVLMILGVAVTGHKGLVLVVLFGMVSSYFYVAPPIRYGYRALGELFVFLNMGLTMVGGTYYAMIGNLPSYIVALGIPVGMMVAGILYFQSLPEIESDKAMGKRTLANTLGPEKAIFLFKLWWPAIWGVLFILYLTRVCAWPVLLGIALCIPVHIQACRKVDSINGDWFSLDQHGKLVRIMYLVCGLSMLFGVALL